MVNVRHVFFSPWDNDYSSIGACYELCQHIFWLWRITSKIWHKHAVAMLAVLLWYWTTSMSLVWGCAFLLTSPLTVTLQFVARGLKLESKNVSIGIVGEDRASYNLCEIGSVIWMASTQSTKEVRKQNSYVYSYDIDRLSTQNWGLKFIIIWWL